METENVDDFLAHHGIKGMKWGVRKTKSVKTLNSKLPKSQDKERADSYRKRGTSNLTNAELKSLNDRLRLESEYNSLTRPQSKNLIKKGKEVMSIIGMTTATLNTVYNFTSGPVGKAIADSLKSKK